MTSTRVSFAQRWCAAVARWPERAAIEETTGASTSYRALHGEAAFVAERLAADGIGAGDLVGLRVGDRRAFCVALMATWLADAVAVPLSATAPDDYVRDIARRVGVAATLVEDPACPSRLGTVWSRADEKSPPVTAGALAYVVHTSGSTGKPKPVALSHRALLSYCDAFIEATELSDTDRFLQLAPVTFDVVFEELLPVWTVGGTVVLAPEVADDPRRLLCEVAERGVTVAELTTVYWQLLVRHLRASAPALPPSLRLLLMGGELAPLDLLQESLDLGLPLAHVYGVTEAGITSTVERFTRTRPVTAAWVGTPLSNTTIQVVDERGALVPDGTIGEVWIGGDSLAEGYLGDLAGTTERFVTGSGPLGDARFYRTGDAGRIVDGRLEIVGRLDAQVKVNGIRVDLTEVEQAVRSSGMVADAAVLAVGDPHAARRLIAYVTPMQYTDPDITASSLRQWLVDRLPSHLVPARILVLDELPVTTHGKVDRRWLLRSMPAVEVDQLAGASPTECLVAAAWSAGSARPLSSLDEGFFDAGGDSLDVISLVVVLDEAGVTITPVDCFVYPTARALAAFIDGTMAPGTDNPEAVAAARRRAHLERSRTQRSAR